MRRLLWPIALFTLLLVWATPNAQAQQNQQKIDQAYQTFIKKSALHNAATSLTVLNAQNGQVVFQDHGQLGLPTASTLKVVTSITALDLLGEDWTFETNLAYSGEIDSLGVLHGDIIIQGSGDPTLGSERYENSKAETILAQFKQAIVQAGIKEIQGSILADDMSYNGYQAPGTWMWTDMGNYYGAGISSLNWKENKIGLHFQPGTVGKKAQLSSPERPYYSIINEVSTGARGTGDNVYGYAAPYSNTIYLRGSYGQDLKKTIEISSIDPALDLAWDLALLLQQDSINYGDTVSTTKRLANLGQRPLSGELTSLMTHKSPTLGQIIYWFNKNSINLYGEALLKMIGGISANVNETEQAAKLLAKYWQGRLNIPLGEINTFDGSGLSPQNRVTTNAIAKIMQYARTRPWFPTFEKALPIINNTSMKSGTIGGVLGYTGYQKSADRQIYTFSLLINNYQGSASSMRQHMFELLNSLK